MTDPCTNLKTVTSSPDVISSIYKHAVQYTDNQQNTQFNFNTFKKYMCLHCKATDMAFTETNKPT